MRMVAARADSPPAASCTMTEETRELARGSPGDLARSGGRLKFFKDGKFILELVRAEGGGGGCGGGGWVSVPRKTFWPPPAPPQHVTRTDRAASLSVSDDNSSVQSSPWQRDHCWKQTTPRKNISKQLCMYYCRPSNLLDSTIGSVSRHKRRRPHDPGLTNGARAISNGAAPARNENGDGSPRGDDRVDGHEEPAADDLERWMDRERYYHMKLKKPYQHRRLRVYRKCRPPARRRPLLAIVEQLAERARPPPAPAPLVNAKLASCRQEHALVSPRKRILRELERVSLEDGGKRRARAAPALPTAHPPGPSRAPPTPPARAPKHVGGYSIHSLLSMDDSPPESKRRTPSLKTESPCSAHSPSPAPPSPLAPAPAPAPGPPPPDWRDVYMYGYAPPFLPPALYRAPPPPPLPWLHYIPPGPWAPLPHPLVTHHIPKEEPSSDLPLNLSKH